MAPFAGASAPASGTPLLPSRHRGKDRVPRKRRGRVTVTDNLSPSLPGSLSKTTARDAGVAAPAAVAVADDEKRGILARRGPATPAPVPRPALTSADIPAVARHELFDLAVGVLKRAMTATTRRAVMGPAGAVVGHVEVDDVAAQLKGAEQTFQLLGSYAARLRETSGPPASAPVTIVVPDWLRPRVPDVGRDAGLVVDAEVVAKPVTSLALCP